MVSAYYFPLPGIIQQLCLRPDSSHTMSIRVEAQHCTDVGKETSQVKTDYVNLSLNKVFKSGQNPGFEQKTKTKTKKEDTSLLFWTL